MRRSILALSAVLALGAGAAAADGPQWMRYPAISPDGATIAFSYRGDIWLAPSAGGDARLLTTHSGYEKMPVWSPDGASLAFASDRHGNFDVFVVAAAGGQATRLTFHSSHDLPSDFTPGGERVVFRSRRLDAPGASLPSTFLEELYSVGITADRPRQLFTTPAEDARFSPDGKAMAYHDRKGYESEWRKHHTSSITRDIWVAAPDGSGHRKVTDFAGEDRNPVWSPDGWFLHYLSERSGSFNVWKLDLSSDTLETTQVTNHGPHPVRFLSTADDGTLCYGLNGEIWVKRPDADPARVSIRAVAGDRVNPTQVTTLRDGATELAVSPKQDEVAFIVRGEVFVASVEHGTTKRVTHTPEQERSLTWAPDGRSLYYAGERGGSWNLYRSKLTRDDEERFFHSTVLAEEPVLVGEDETFRPELSPDGKQIAYLHNRDEIRVLDVASGQSRTVVPAERNYSYADGDIDYSWSPDSKWLSFTYIAHQRWLDDVGAANVATGEIVNITDSGYYEGAPKWSRDSRALLFYSDRFGRRSHGSWGSDRDVMALYLTQEAYDRAVLSREEFDRLKEKEDKEKRKGKRKGKKQDDEEDDDEEDDEPAKPVKIELDGCEFRLRRLTIHSAPVADYALSNDGEVLVYLARVEDKWDLWMSKMRDSETRKIVSFGDSGAGEVEFSKNGKSVFVRRGNGKIVKIDVGGLLQSDGPRGRRGGRGGGGQGGGGGGGNANQEPVAYAAEMTIHTPEERAHLFEHAWRQVKRKFYDPNLHGVDWPAMKQNYAAFLPDIATNDDFAELLSEMLGELNASHTGCRHRPQRKDGDETASLGLIYDTTHTGAGLKVAEVLVRGPADKAESKIGPGTIVTAIDGVALGPDVNPAKLLNRKAGKRVRVALQAGSNTWEEVLKPIALRAEGNLRYERWLLQRRAFTEKASGGRVGYVHVRGMNESSFRRTFRETLGRNSDKEALVVDTRFNGGGWLHEDLTTFLRGSEYIWFVPRGKTKGQFGAEPFNKWTRPVAVVQSESNYSDAHMFPFAFKALGVGKLIGTPVAGTGTAVWWERLIDPSLVFGIPQVGMMDANGNYLENQELQPDVLVYTDPESYTRGDDPQLAKAVEVLLSELDE